MTVLATVPGRGAHAGVVTDHPSGEVPERAKRRTFTAAYKLKIVQEYEDAEPGARGAVLRREGLYVFSRKTVGWMVATRESATLAEQLLAATIKAEQVPASQLTIHADRGSSMASKPVALLLADLGVTKTHSRPRVSNDNAYSESQFKTLKYCPAFPGTFASLEHAREFCAEFFYAYNHHHRHVGLGLLTPEVVHSGQAKTVHARRTLVLDTAHALHRNRFRRPPQPPKLPGSAWINKPPESEATTQ